MDLHALSNQELLVQTQNAVAREREATTAVLYHLRAIEKRLLFAEAGFCSMFDYVVNALGYSEAAACRRLNAMKLIQDLPEVVQALGSGSLSLSNASSAQTFFKREEREQGKVYSVDQKKEVLKALEQKSKIDCQKILMSLSPASAIPSETQRAVTDTQIELRVVLSQEVMEKLEKLKGLLAHQNPSGSFAQLIELMADSVLDRIDPIKKQERAEKRHAKILKSDESDSAAESASSQNQRFIAAAMRRQVFIRDENQCTYTDEKSGRRCQSRFGLQIDHFVVPVALGGTSELSQLTLRCRNHNLYGAHQVFGSIMETYLPSMR